MPAALRASPMPRRLLLDGRSPARRTLLRHSTVQRRDGSVAPLNKLRGARPPRPSPSAWMGRRTGTAEPPVVCSATIAPASLHPPAAPASAQPLPPPAPFPSLQAPARTGPPSPSNRADAAGFIEIERKAPAPYRPAADRLADYAEINGPADQAELTRQSARCMDCGTPFCHTHTGCPISNVIPEFNQQVFDGEWRQACSNLDTSQTPPRPRPGLLQPTSPN